MRLLFLFVAKSCLTFCDPRNCCNQASLSFTISLSLLTLLSIESLMSSNHLILCHIPISSCPQSFPASGSFPIRQLFTSSDQSIGASASASVLPMNTQAWFPLGLASFISLLSKGCLTVIYNLKHHHNLKHQILCCSAFFMAQISYPYLTIGKIIALTRWTCVGIVMSLTFNIKVIYLNILY